MDFGVVVVRLFRLGTLFLLLIPVCLAYHWGFNRSYFFVADPDIILIGEALAFNSGYPQSYFDQPTFLYIITLGWWYQLLYSFDILSIYNFATLNGLDSVATDFQTLIFYTRIFSVVVLSTTLLAFSRLVYLITESRYVALLSLMLLSTSQGVGLHAVICRMEPFSLLFLLLSFLSLVHFAKSTKPWDLTTIRYSIQIWFFLYLSALTKILAIFHFIILAPIFAYGSILKFTCSVKGSPGIKVLVAVLSGLSIVILASAPNPPELISTSTLLYLAALFTFIIIFYAKRFNHSLVMLYVLSIPVGITLGYLTSHLRYHPKIHLILLTFYEHASMFKSRYGWTPWTQPTETTLSLFSDHLLTTLYSKIHLVWLVQYPIQILFYVSIWLMIRSYRMNKNREAITQLLFLLAYLFLEIMSRLRVNAPREYMFDLFNFDTVSYYKIYAETVLVLAFAIGMKVCVSGSLNSKIIISCVSVVALALSLLSQRQTFLQIKHDTFAYYSVNQPPENLCTYSHYNLNLARYLDSEGKCRDRLKNIFENQKKL